MDPATYHSNQLGSLLIRTDQHITVYVIHTVIHKCKNINLAKNNNFRL